MKLFRTAILSALACTVAVSAPAQDAGTQQQVQVSVKIVEFQTVKGVETGLNAYFRQRNEPRPYMRVSSGNGNITAADLTFPTSTNAGITVFLDRISNQYGDFEVVLQGLVDRNRASILAQPKAMVMVGQEVPTIIETTQRVPYEDTRVVGATAVQIVSFRDAGVSLSVQALDLIDDDGDLTGTADDTYIQLLLTAAVKEEGQRITVSLAEQAAGSSLFGGSSNAIRVPEFVSREITTTVWVRSGEVLALGGLYRDTRNKDLSTLPWLTQGEDFVNNVVQRLSPVSVGQVPLSAGLGRQSTEEGRRELVFLLKAERWRPPMTVEFAPDNGAPAAGRPSILPTRLVTDIIEQVSTMPQGLGEAIRPQSGDEVTRSLGGGD